MQEPRQIGKSISKFKIVFLGDQAVGKTSIITRFVNETFSGTHQVNNQQKYSIKPTIGIDFISKCMQFDNKTVRLQLWDTAGQERFRSLIPSYIRDSNAAVICFDITNKISFDNVGKWLDYVRDERGEDVFNCLIGNKLDMDAERLRAISKEEVQKYAKEQDLTYFEVSAKEGININQTFKSITQLLLGENEKQNQVDEQTNYQPSGGMTLNNQQSQEEKKPAQSQCQKC